MGNQARLLAWWIAACVAIPKGLFLLLRVNVFEMPLGLFEAIWLVAVASILNLHRLRRWLVSFYGAPLALFAFTMIFQAFYGFYLDQEAYEIFKFFRAEALFIAGFLVAGGFGFESRLYLLRALTMGGSIAGMLQVLTFVFAVRGVNIWTVLGVGLIEDASASFTFTLDNLSLARDTGVGISFAALSLTSLLASRIMKVRLFRPSLWWAFSSASVLGIVASLTRGVWVAAIISVVVVVIVLRKRLSATSVTLTAATLILATLILAPFGQLLGSTVMGQAAESRMNTFLHLEDDSTLAYRFAESEAALEKMDGRYLLGLGAESVTVSEGGDMISNDQLHNGYLQYFMVGGVLGLGSLVWVIFRSLRVAWIGSKNPDRTASLVGAVSLAVAIGTCFEALAGGVFNEALRTPMVGVLLAMGGLAAAYRAPQESQSAPNGPMEPTSLG